jgi:hypothetical protein
LETLLHVAAPTFELPAAAQATDQEPVPGLHLRGYDLYEHYGHWQGWLRLKAWWQAPDGMRSPFKVSARLLNTDGQVVTVTDAAPVAGAYPAPDWRPGEVVADAYEIPLPAGLPPGLYDLWIIVYEPDSGVELGRVQLPPTQLEGNPARPPRQALADGMADTTCAVFADLRLLGYTAPGTGVAYHSGDTLPLMLLWQARTQLQGDLELSLWLDGYDGGALVEAPVGAPFPAGRWSQDQVVRQWLSPRVPESIPPGTYPLKMRVSRGSRPLPWGCWLLPLGSDLQLGMVQVQ